MSRFSGSLRGRVAIVTGGSRGVGRACAVALAGAGCHVTLAARTQKPHAKLPGTIHTVADEIRERYPDVEVLPLACNVRREEDILSVVERTVQELGSVDILINNAGAAWWYPVLETPAKRFDLVMEVNFRAAHIASRAVIPEMLKRGFGHIINMSPPVDKASLVVSRMKRVVSGVLSERWL